MRRIQPEDVDFMRRVLPDHYSVVGLENGVHCKSRKGIDEYDEEHWAYVTAAIKQHFGERFMEIDHNTCYNHVNFVVYLKAEILTATK